MTRLLPLEGNYSFQTNLRRASGLHIRFHSKSAKRDVVLAVNNQSISLSDWTGSPSKRVDHYTAFAKNLPQGSDPSADILIKVRKEQWWVYINNLPVITFQQPFPLPAYLEIYKRNALHNKRVRFQKVTPSNFAAEFMDEDTETAHLIGWKTKGGTWKIHTANQDAIAQHTSRILKEKPLSPELSPNFYSLEASGTGKLLNGYHFEDNYDLRASIQTGPVEAGLVFYYQDERNYYTFGLTPMQKNDVKAILTLVRYSTTRMPRKTVLTAVEVDLTVGQWVMPQVRINDRQITCYLDNHKVIDIEEEMPSGGMYGLYAACDDSVEPTARARFDDVQVRAVRELRLPNIQAIRFHTIDSENDLYEQESAMLRFLRGGKKNPPGQSWIDSSISGNPRWIAIGDTEHTNHRFSADFTVKSKVFDIALLACFRGRDTTYYRFHCHFNGERLKTFCEEVSPQNTRQLQSRETPISLKQLGTQHALRIVSTRTNLLKLYHNNQLIFVQPITSCTGASGIYLGRSTQARVSNLSYEFEPRLDYTNKYEKNINFVEDPFMKHWSSPEGEWYTDLKKRETWHKSDFFGEYSLSMPWVPQSEIHLSVPEGKMTGDVMLRADTSGELKLFVHKTMVKTLTLPHSIMSNNVYLKGKTPAYTVHAGGHAIWVVSDGQLIGHHHLKTAGKGSRVRVQGFTNAHLANSATHRENVYDALFTQALHDWKVGGGTWQVINRFECKPELSHLNGENGNGPACLWSKHRFKGDFCVEFYVGIRQGEWYMKSGRDFNLTMMNSQSTPGSGYTITCAGWEPNEMQRLTRLYKNGVLLKSSDTYTAPQVRFGNYRKLVDPVISRGRDVHGAWYYIKFRRRGDKLEYFFDNEKILSYVDKKPIDLGSLGIWTYNSSMMVARVKASADSIEPAWFPIRTLRSLPSKRKRTVAAQQPAIGLEAGDLPADLMQPKHWHAELATSHCIAEWQPANDTTGAYIVQKNIYGGGSMLLAPTIPALPLDKISGIRFSVKRSEATHFNFHYSLHQASKSKTAPKKRYIHRLSGSEAGNPDWTIAGATPLPERTNPGNWTDVVVWFPTHIKDRSRYVIKIDGFGNLNPSYIQQGLVGNTPGTTYAVADVALIYASIPAFKQTIERHGGAYRLRNLTGSRYNQVASRDAQIVNVLSNKQQLGLNGCEISLTKKNLRLQPVAFYWNHVPDTPEYSVQWHPRIPYAIQFRNQWHDPRLACSQMQVNRQTMLMAEENSETSVGHLPFTALKQQEAIELRFQCNKKSDVTTLSFKDCPTNVYPILHNLDGPVAFMIDADLAGKIVSSGQVKHTLQFDEMPNRYLLYQNKKYNQRLNMNFYKPIDLTQYPIMAFRYKCDDSAAISIRIDASDIAFTEKAQAQAQTIRYAQAKTDNKWHSWLGAINNVEFKKAFSKKALTASRLTLGSTHKISQTGRYATFAIDNLVAGPVIRDASMLRFKPAFLCPGGIKQVEYAIISGKDSYYDLTSAAVDKLQWVTIPNGAFFEPKLKHLRHTVGRLIIRAISSQGVSSQIFEIPFMLDKLPMNVRYAFESANQPNSNGQRLALDFSTENGASADLTKLKLSSGTTSLQLNPRAAQLRHSRDKDVLFIDWPYLLRKDLDSPQEKGISLTVSGICDGAGNTSDDITIAIPKTRGTDRLGPTWLSLKPTTTRALAPSFIFPWTDPLQEQPAFQCSQATTKKDMHEFNHSPYVRLKGYKQNLYGWLQVSPGAWDLDKYPFISLAIRMPKELKTGTIFMEVKGRGQYKATQPLVVHTDKARARNKTWQYMTFNIKKLMSQPPVKRNSQKNIRKTTRPAAPGIWHIAIQGTQINKNFELDIRDLMVHGSWSPADKLVVESYDASGVSHYEYEISRQGRVIAKGTLDTNRISPASFLAPARPDDWFSIYAVDNVGNRSYPVRLPAGK